MPASTDAKANNEDDSLSREEYLSNLADELHKPVRKKYPVQRVYSSKLDDTWSLDLVEMGEHASVNDGYKYILTVIDLWSRYAWAVPLKDKTAKAVKDAVASIIRRSGRQPSTIWVDRGSEFYNATLSAFLKSKNIKRYSTYGPHKASVIERFNRTLKTRMFKRFTAENTRRWVDMLPGLLASYNSTVHSSIKISPNEALTSAAQAKLKAINDPDDKASSRRQKPTLALGDSVRVSRVKGVFEKGYIANWSLEVFTIASVIEPFSGPVTYKLADYNGDRIDGSFYEAELQKIEPSNVFFVGQILKRRTRKGVKEIYVRWEGYPKSFDSWIRESDAVGL